jgi:hypothetical protein
MGGLAVVVHRIMFNFIVMVNTATCPSNPVKAGLDFPALFRARVTEGRQFKGFSAG